MTDKEVMQMALDALECWQRNEDCNEPMSNILEALRTALAQRKPLTNGEICTAYITATDQTLRPQDERLAFAFARAIEAAHGIKENG